MLENHDSEDVDDRADPTQATPSGESAEVDGAVTFDWGARYREENTPWDLEEGHPELAARLQAGDPSLKVHGTGRALVPGCGKANDALLLAQAGWEVTGLDMVPELEDFVKARLGPYGGSFQGGDALSFGSDPVQPQFQLIFEHTFFCALPKARRVDWGRFVSNNLVPGGYLVAMVFPYNRPVDKEGPPHRTRPEHFAEALGSEFRMLSEDACQYLVERREWEEHWAVFQKRSAD